MATVICDSALPWRVAAAEAQAARIRGGAAGSRDGADVSYRARLFAAVNRAATPGAVAVLRSFGEPNAALPTNHAAEDRAILWGIVDVKPAAAL